MMIVLLNGPLGVGKSTLAEALVETLEHSVMLDGDKLIAINPEPPYPLEYLYSILEFLIPYHRRFGYRNFFIDYIWRSPAEIADLQRRLVDDADFRCFLLTLPADENLRRIERRASARGLEEREFELRMNREERQMLDCYPGEELGELFDVSPPLSDLVSNMLHRLNLG